MTFTHTLRRFDWAMLASVGLLTLLSVVLLATAGAATGTKELATRQGVFFIAAVLLAFFVGRVHYRAFRSLAGPAYVITLLLLLIPLLQGNVIRGAAAWITVGSTRLQPAELMKVALLLVLARIVGGNRGRTLSTPRLIAALAALALPAALILRQPDLGTVVLLAAATLGIVMIVGLSRGQKIVLVGGSLLLMLLAWKFLLVGYQKERLFVFVNPERDPYGSGYSVLQARTAVGSGGLVGRGLGWGPQSRLNFLPEAHTDFVFARIGEELGLVGVFVTLGLFAVLFHRTTRAAYRTSDPFGRALAVGAAITLAVGCVVNIGMNVGLLPVTGIPLPFLSYGGSSLLTSYLLLGLVASVVVHGERWEDVAEESVLTDGHA